MNLVKLFTLIFIILSIVILVYISIFKLGSKRDSFEFFGSEKATNYVNYYIKRSDYRFKLSVNSFIIEKASVGKAEFNRDENVDKFLASWSPYDEVLYPNRDCEFVRISIPASVNNISSGGILFACVDSYINDFLNIENVQ